MKITKTNIALTISQPGETFASEANMLRWISSCLNCNVNHAQVQVEKLPEQPSTVLAQPKIEAAFQAVKSLLDASGALESEALQRAVYQLRLEIESAAGDHERVQAASLSLQELNASDSAPPDQGALADKAYAEYDFGPGLVVTDASGWEYTTPGHERSRKVYVEKVAGLETENASWQLNFSVEFDPVTGGVRNAYALDGNGQPVGKRPT